MQALQLRTDGAPLRVLCIGAHSDDIEIGCAGTLLDWQVRYGAVDVTWAVLSAEGAREAEARRSASALLRRAAARRLVLGRFRDSLFPAQLEPIKQWFGELAAACTPDVVLTHLLEDRHQDHRVVAEVTWQTFRDHLVLEYEIPKYEGDLGQPQLYVPLSAGAARRKVAHLMRHFASQRSRHWFREETFRAMMAVRGLECRAESGYAEAYHLRKAIL